MAIYDYICNACGTKIEVIKSIKDESDEICPECGEVMERLIGNTSFYIKGYAPGKAFKSANELRRNREKAAKKTKP